MSETIDPADLRLGPRESGPTQAEIDAACEAFMTRWSAGSTDDQGRTGLARDIAAALSAAFVLNQTRQDGA